MTVGDRIKTARIAAGLTQKELAEKCGLATGTIQQYELNKRIPKNKDIVERLANTLNVPGVYIMWGPENIAESAKQALYATTEATQQALDYITESSRQVINDATRAVQTTADAIGEAARNQIDMVENMRRSQLLANYENVNTEGRRKIVAYSCDIADNPKYRKKDTDE